MTGKLIDIKESDLVLTLKDTAGQISGIDSYRISRRRDSIGVDFSLTFPKIINIEAGSQVSFKGIDGIAATREIRSTPNGYITIINGVSIIGELIRKAPKKTLMYMSMTAAEIDQFKVDTKEDYDDLDYIPLIKQCDAMSGTNGWNCQDVISDLAAKAGLTMVVNTYNYWLKQVQASSNSSYFETILSLVNFLRPIIYSDEDNVIYIIDRPLSSGSIEISRNTNLNQRSSYNFESKTKYFYVEGGMGKWDRSKAKIEAEPESETVLESETYQEKPMLLTTNFWGGRELTHTNETESDQTFKDYKDNDVVIHPGETKTYQAPDSTVTWKIQGREGTEQKNTIQLGRWLEQPMRERYTTTEIWRLDPFGNFKCLISRHTVGYNETVGANVLDSLEEYSYDFLTEEYDKPRLMTKKTTTGRYTWMVVEGIGLKQRYFKGKTDEISESWGYSDSGLLLQETMTRSMDVVKLQDGDEYAELDLADAMWVPEGGEALNVERATVEEVVTNYRQINPDYYEKSTTTRRLGALSRKVGQENYSVKADQIRGKVPRHPTHYRQSMIWAGDTFGADATDSQEVPTMTLSNPNIIDWNDAEAILGRLKSFAAEANLTERTLSVPMDIPIDVGWEIDLKEVLLAGGENIPAVEVVNYTNVVSWSKTVRANPPSCMTTIVVEAR